MDFPIKILGGVVIRLPSTTYNPVRLSQDAPSIITKNIILKSIEQVCGLQYEHDGGDEERASVF